MVDLALIYAVAADGYIGKTSDGKIGFPWPFRLKGDLPRFSNLTKGDPNRKGSLAVPHPVIMGRKTYDSLPDKFKPLDGGRFTIVVSGSADYHGENLVVVSSMEAALSFLDSVTIDGLDTSLAFVAGGYRPYNEAFASGLVKKIYETRVHGSYGGDTKLPPELFNLDRSAWQEVKRELHPEGTHTYVDWVKK